MIFEPPYSVVIIDDDPEIINIMTLVLNTKYPDIFKINPYTKFSTGFEFISKNEINIVFVDLNLLDIDGITGIEKIRELHKRCQIVAFSGDHELNTILTCYESGADLFMRKPINKEGLGAVVDKCIAPFESWYNLIQEVSAKKDSK